MKNDRKNTIYLWALALAISACGVCISVFVWPVLMGVLGDAGRVEAGLRPGGSLLVWVVFAALAVCIVAAASGLVCILRGRRRESGFGGIFAGTLLVALIFAVCAVLVSLLCGGLAVLLQGILSRMDIAGIKQAISITSGVIAVLLLPLLIAAAFGYAYNEQGVFGGMRRGLSGLRRSYWRLLCILGAGLALGYGISWVLRPGGVFYGMADVIKAILLSVLGAAGIVLCAKICAAEQAE